MNTVNSGVVMQPVAAVANLLPKRLRDATVLVLVLVTFPVGLNAATPPADTAEESGPLMFTDLENPGLATRFKRLKEDQRATFYQAYPPEVEMLRRVMLGLHSQKIEECIAGEAPTIDEAIKKFPLHYPMMGRMKRVSGVLKWTDKKKLVFRTESQQYLVGEYFLLYRLSQMGFTNKSEPTEATLDACWMVNPIDGLRLIYMQGIDLH